MKSVHVDLCGLSETNILLSDVCTMLDVKHSVISLLHPDHMVLNCDLRGLSYDHKPHTLNQSLIEDSLRNSVGCAEAKVGDICESTAKML